MLLRPRGHLPHGGLRGRTAGVAQSALWRQQLRHRRRFRRGRRALPSAPHRRGPIRRRLCRRIADGDARRLLHGVFRDGPSARAAGCAARRDGSARALSVRRRGVDQHRRADRRGVARAVRGDGAAGARGAVSPMRTSRRQNARELDGNARSLDPHPERSRSSAASCSAAVLRHSRV